MPSDNSGRLGRIIRRLDRNDLVEERVKPLLHDLRRPDKLQEIGPGGHRGARSAAGLMRTDEEIRQAADRVQAHQHRVAGRQAAPRTFHTHLTQLAGHVRVLLEPRTELGPPPAIGAVHKILDKKPHTPQLTLGHAIRGYSGRDRPAEGSWGAWSAAEEGVQTAAGEDHTAFVTRGVDCTMPTTMITPTVWALQTVTDVAEP